MIAFQRVDGPTEDQVREAIEAVRSLAERKARLPMPPGFDADDFCSAGGEAVAELARSWTPAAGPWAECVDAAAKAKMREALNAARRQTRKATTLDVRLSDGTELPRADVRATDPAAQAEARELLRPGKKAKAGTLARIKGQLDGVDPVKIAAKANRLRAQMVKSVSVRDVDGVMKALVAKATAGHLESIKAFLSLVGTGTPGLSINLEQNVVVVANEDVD